MIISGWRSTGRLLPPSLCGPRHSGSGELFQTSSRQTLDQVASNLRTSCEQTDNAFKKRVEEVQIRFDFRCDNKIMDAAYEKPTFCPKVREAKQKLEKQKAETIVKLQEVLNFHNCQSSLLLYYHHHSCHQHPAAKSYIALSLFSKSRITQMINLINIAYTSASMVCLCPVNAS